MAPQDPDDIPDYDADGDVALEPDPDAFAAHKADLDEAAATG